MSDATHAPTTRKHTAVDFGHGLVLEGQVEHHPSQNLLVLITDEGTERLSVSLEPYGISPAPRNVFIKDYSEHTGLTQRLVAAGLVTIMGCVTAGPNWSLFYEVTPTL